MRAITELFSEATGEVVENAVNAANALGSLERCEDVALLRWSCGPRGSVDEGARHRVEAAAGEAEGALQAGRWKEMTRGADAGHRTRAIGYEPLIAEALALSGRAMARSNDTKAAERTLIEAFWAADARDTTRFGPRSLALVYVFGFQQGRFDEAALVQDRRGGVAAPGRSRAFPRVAAQRFGIGALHARRTRQRSLKHEGMALKEKALGREHADVGVSEGNIAFALQSWR